MSAKREKAKRKTVGISVAARREQQEFDRLVASSRERFAERRRVLTRRGRRVLAVAGLVVIAAGLIVAVLA